MGVKMADKKHGGDRAGSGRPTIGDVKMSPTQLKARQRKIKRDGGLIDKTFWLLPEDIEAVKKLEKKALKTLK